MDDNRKKALAQALGQIEKQFGKGSVMRMGDGGASRDIEAVSTGSAASSRKSVIAISVVGLLLLAAAGAVFATMRKEPGETAAAEPPLDPPGTLEISHGFFVEEYALFSHDDPIANSSILFLPNSTNPLLRKRSVTVAS